MDLEKKEVLETAYAYLNKIIQTFDRIIEELRGNSVESGEALSDGLEGILWIADVLQHTADIHMLNPDFDAIRQLFTETLTGMENKDYKHVSEILENEFMPLLAMWFDVVEEALESDENPGEAVEAAAVEKTEVK